MVVYTWGSCTEQCHLICQNEYSYTLCCVSITVSDMSNCVRCGSLMVCEVWVTDGVWGVGHWWCVGCGSLMVCEVYSSLTVCEVWVTDGV